MLTGSRAYRINPAAKPSLNRFQPLTRPSWHTVELFTLLFLPAISQTPSRPSYLTVRFSTLCFLPLSYRSPFYPSLSTKQTPCLGEWAGEVKKIRFTNSSGEPRNLEYETRASTEKPLTIKNLPFTAGGGGGDLIDPLLTLLLLPILPSLSPIIITDQVTSDQHYSVYLNQQVCQTS